MALIKCPECGGQLSDKAKKCPHCGATMEKILSLLSSSSVQPAQKVPPIVPVVPPLPVHDFSSEPTLTPPVPPVPGEMSTQSASETVSAEIPKEPVPAAESSYEPYPEQAKAPIPVAAPASAPAPTPINVIPEPAPESAPTPAPAPESQSDNSHQGDKAEPVKVKPRKRSSAALISIIVVAALGLLGAGGYFYYDKVYLPKKIDAEAPRYYTYAPSVVMRTTPAAGADYNKLGSLPYGTELITYSAGSEWCNVKVNSVGNPLNGQVGYVAAPYVLGQSDFFLLNSIFGDNDSKVIIKTAKCRKALLDYYKNSGYIGKLAQDEANALGLPSPTSDNQWQVFCKQESSKKNNVYYARLYDRSSKFTDFAVIIKNINSGDRKLLYFAFDDDESVIWSTDKYAPADGCITRITGGRDYYGDFDLSVSYEGDYEE